MDDPQWEQFTMSSKWYLFPIFDCYSKFCNKYPATFACSNSTEETLEKSVKHVKCSTIETQERNHWRHFGFFIVNFEHFCSASIVDLKGTLMQIWKFHYMFGFIKKQYPQNSAFLILRISRVIYPLSLYFS